MKHKFKELYLSFANPKTWRCNIQEDVSKGGWEKIRLRILNRDNHSCNYCGFKATKRQIVHHIDGNPNNNTDKNLEVICPLCNLIHHSGFGCKIQRVVDLYKKSKYSQNEIIRLTRELRSRGKSDLEIVKYLGLKEKVPFIMDKNYLRELFGFITSKPPLKWRKIKISKVFLKEHKNTK